MTRHARLDRRCRCSILPTAGIGASMAMEFAAARADELSHADADSLDLALRRFASWRKRVDTVQTASLGAVVAAAVADRDAPGVNQAFRFVDEDRLLGNLRRVLEDHF
jgi:2-polyprenyl-6-methoxyphenol hydroxylase-like FAD-dependent oxidoreductase